jgi:endonuclease/exonuclease/phosphatase family metal-dependent hydrolase
MAFTIATLNVLADAYIKPEWYPYSPLDLLRPGRRLPALADHVAALDADVLCLQEVEPAAFAALDRRLTPAGYTGDLALKGGGKPDGCAAFTRTRTFELVRAVRVEYRDGPTPGRASGHVGQLLVLRAGGRLLGVANTHLKWDPPGTPRDATYGYRQVRQLLAERSAHAPDAAAWIIAGDFNQTSDGAVAAALHAAGFASSHAACPGATCNPRRRAKTIDFLFHDAALRADPAPLPAVGDDMPLPGPGQPSDHVAVVARFAWAVEEMTARRASEGGEFPR